MRQEVAAVSVGTYWAWETTATLQCARHREALRRPQRQERGGGISWRPPARLQVVIKNAVFPSCARDTFVFGETGQMSPGMVE